MVMLITGDWDSLNLENGPAASAKRGKKRNRQRERGQNSQKATEREITTKAIGPKREEVVANKV